MINPELKKSINLLLKNSKKKGRPIWKAIAENLQSEPFDFYARLTWLFSAK